MSEKNNTSGEWKEWVDRLDKAIEERNIEVLENQILELENRDFKTNLELSSLCDGHYTMAKELKKRIPNILNIFHKTLNFSELMKIMKIFRYRIYSTDEIINFLTEIASQLKTEELFEILDNLKLDIFLMAEDRSGIYKEFIERDDISIRDGLVGRIDQKILELTKKNDNVPYSAHQRFWSTFSHIQLKPGGTAVVELMQILMARKDEGNKAYFLKLFEELPFGEDSFVTKGLIELFSEQSDSDYREAIRKGLNKYDKISPMRFYLLDGLYNLSKKDFLECILKDLTKDASEDDRLRLLKGGLEPVLKEIDKNSIDISSNGHYRVATTKNENLSSLHDSHINMLKNLQVRSWDFFSRCYLDEILKKYLPSSLSYSFASTGDRLLYGMTKAFLKVRIDHMGCGCILPVLLIIAYTVNIILDMALGRPDIYWMKLAEIITILLWIFTVGGTSRTHFSGQDTLQDCRNMAICYWFTTFLWIATTIAVHLYPFLH